MGNLLSLDNLFYQVSQLHSAMIRWMITVLLRLTPDMEDKELEQINKQVDDHDVDASLGGGEILLQAIPEEICNRARGLFGQLREFSVVLAKCCSDLVIDLMQASYKINKACIRFSPGFHVIKRWQISAALSIRDSSA